MVCACTRWIHNSLFGRKGWTLSWHAVNMLAPPEEYITPTDNLLFGLPHNFGRKNEEGVAMVETVRKNFEGFTAKEVKDATYAYARKAQGMVGSPSDDEFASMVSTMRNCPIKRSDIANATAIFGPNRNVLRGKTVRQRPQRVDADFVQIPWDYYVLHKFVTLTADLMFVNGIPFLVTLLREIRLYTAEYMPT